MKFGILITVQYSPFYDRQRSMGERLYDFHTRIDFSESASVTKLWVHSMMLTGTS
jgi:hypothetical protein